MNVNLSLLQSSLTRRVQTSLTRRVQTSLTRRVQTSLTRRVQTSLTRRVQTSLTRRVQSKSEVRFCLAPFGCATRKATKARFAYQKTFGFLKPCSLRLRYAQSYKSESLHFFPFQKKGACTAARSA
jgi:hypothetical protein